MDNNTNEQNTTETPEATKNHAKGPIVGIIIIVLVLIFGGFYLWTQRPADTDISETPEEIKQSPDASLDSLLDQGTSDELSDIEDDLSATDLTELDAELQKIQEEFDNF